MRLINLFNSWKFDNFSIRPPYIIAEAGVNHEANMDLAYRLIDEAADGGAHAIKFQTYKAETIASRNSPHYWSLDQEPTTSQYSLFQKYDKFWKNEYEKLKLYCDESDIEFMSTPFDKESARFLNDMMDVFKISSSDITNKPFIDYICSFKKPIILSTGASYMHEIHEAVEWIDSFDIPVALLHCILNYPTDNNNANLGMILDLKRKFQNRIIGYSDHTLPNDMKVLEVANLLGASIIEKHFTHDKTLSGNDHYHAMDKDDLKLFCKNIKSLFSILGHQHKHAIESEKIARDNARRSLVASRDIKKGEVITSDHLTWKRPAHGVSPRFIDSILGKTARIPISEDELIQWNMLHDK